MPEDEFKMLEKELRLSIKNIPEYSERDELGFVRIGYTNCHDNDIAAICSTIVSNFSTQKSSSVLQYRIAEDYDVYGVISRFGTEELDINRVLKECVLRKKQQMRNEEIFSETEDACEKTADANDICPQPL